MDKQTEIAVDIGGGRGEYFLKRAINEPQKTFVVLDPQIENIPDKPENLILIKWKSDVDSKLPLSFNSVDEINMNMLMGELKTNDANPRGNLEKELFPFRRILRETKNILKDGGEITICEPKANIDYAVKLLNEEGYQIVKSPSQVEDERKSKFIELFYSFFKNTRNDQKDSLVLPMEVKAILKK